MWGKWPVLPSEALQLGGGVETGMKGEGLQLLQLGGVSHHLGVRPAGGATVHPEALLAPIYPLHRFFYAVGVNQIKSKLEPSPSCPYLLFLNPVQVLLQPFSN